MTAEKAIEILEERWRYSKTYKYTDAEIREAFDMAIKALEQQPKTGRWINLENTKYKGQVLPFWGRYECSKCGGHGEGTFNYCPNCGAKMRESEDKE